MKPDSQLLAKYATQRDESSFAELVQRHLDHVYCTALRLVGGDTHLAQDVVQTVFTDLARNAGSLSDRPVLGGWLHTTARYAAAKLVRAEQRRRQREQTALAMNSAATDPDWNQIRAFLDESIGDLKDPERDALILRYFEKKPLAEVGAALGVSEDAARMRVDRAIDKLRTRLAVRGIASTAATLSTVLAQNLVGTAPGALGARITASALADAAVVTTGGAATGWLPIGKLAVVTALVSIVGTVGWLQFKKVPQVADAVGTAAEPAAIITASTQLSSPVVAVPTVQPPRQGGLELLFLDAETGHPITNQTAVLRGWERGHNTMVNKPVTVKDGRCVAPFDPATGPGFQILTHVDGYADTRLRWSPGRGEVIPDSYTLRLIRPALIYGRVLDTAGNPVAGATVGFNTENVTAQGTVTEDHGVDYLTVETDADGYWQLNRLAPEMVRRVASGASHPEYSRSEPFYASRDPNLVQQLFDGTAVFRLQEGVVVRGKVLDEGGRPMGSALVRVGKMGSSQSRETRTEPDGSFTVRGCEAGPGLVTADLDGYAPTARALTLESNLAPLHLTLGAGRILRLRVLDTTERPVVDARVLLDSFPRGERQVPIPQVPFRGSTDAEGRLVWENAPDQPLEFDVAAPGYVRLHGFRVRPDDEEHIVTLSRALVISGTVRNSATGIPIPMFRVGIGWPEQGPDGTMQPRWSELDRFWLKFSGGEFRHTLEEMVIGGAINRGYVFRFEAEGHKPFITRAYQPDEGDVRLDVELMPAQDVRAMAYQPDGKPAPNAQVGLVSPGTEVKLVPGGFAGDLGHALAWLRRADPDGWFTVPDDDEIDRVIVASPDGYAEARTEELREARAVRLVPWSRIEGSVRTDGQPVGNAEVRLLWSSPALALSFNAPAVRTDSEGGFTFPQVPPGSFQVFVGAPGHDFGSAKPRIEVAAGETKQVVLEDVVE